MSASRLIERIEPRLLLASVQVFTDTFTDPADGVTTQDAQIWIVNGNSRDGVDPNATGSDIDDNIVVRPSSNNLQIEAYLNGTLLGSVAKSSVRGVLIQGFQGNDTLTVLTTENPNDSNNPYQIDVPAQFNGGKGNDTLLGGPETSIFQGGVGDDNISGGAGRDVGRGGFGNDTLAGGPGRDSMFGGADNDLIYGGAASDTLLGGPGNDTTFGGNDNDLIVGGPSDGSQSDIDNLSGNAGNDTVYANAADFDVTDNDSSNPNDVYTTTSLTGAISVATHISLIDLVTVTGEDGLRDLNRNFTLNYKISTFLFTT